MSAAARFETSTGAEPNGIALPDFKTIFFKFPTFGTIAYDGSPGWNFVNFLLTLRYANNPSAVPRSSYLATFNCTSVGRCCSDAAWPINAILMRNDQPLRELTIGLHRAQCSSQDLAFSGDFVSHSHDLPGELTLDEFSSINKVRLYSAGRQEAC